jgi:hypothetical protein
MRKVLVDKDGLVINAIEIEDGADWQPPEGHRLLSKQDSDLADIGDEVKDRTLHKKEFTDREGRTQKPDSIDLDMLNLPISI